MISKQADKGDASETKSDGKKKSSNFWYKRLL